MLKDINVFNESFFYKEESFKIAQRLIESLAMGFEDYNGYIPWEYNHSILNNENFISWTYNIIRDDSEFIKKRGFDIWASAGPDEYDEPSIHVTFVIPKGKWIKKINIPFPTLVGVIAHEIHHLAQNNPKLLIETSPNKDENICEKMKYFLDPIEVEAFHIGFRAESILSGVSSKVLMTDYLKCFLDDYQISHVLNSWLNPSFNIIKESLSG